MIDAMLISNAVLWLVVLMLLFVVFALARQIGVLHERIAPAGALMPTRGVLVGERVPAAQLTDLGGRAFPLGGARARGLLVLFVSPTCPICKTLVPVAANLARREGLDLLYASDGDDIEAHRRYAASQRIEAPYVLSAEFGRAHEVAKLPFALLIDAAGVLRAKGLVNSREHLESLLEAEATGVAHIQEFMHREGHTS
jgi:methylamine dehydrogenase accessory protein MauD